MLGKEAQSQSPHRLVEHKDPQLADYKNHQEEQDRWVHYGQDHAQGSFTGEDR